MARVNIRKVQPEIYEAMSRLESYIAKSTIDKKLQELVRLRASVINGCEFCTEMHIEGAIKLGDSPCRIGAITDWHQSNLFSEKERAALAASDDITMISEAGLRDETYKLLINFFTEEEIAQLIVLCSVINAWNRLGISMSD